MKASKVAPGELRGAEIGWNGTLASRRNGNELRCWQREQAREIEFGSESRRWDFGGVTDAPIYSTATTRARSVS